MDFVQLHYFISDRRDSEFWIENTEKLSLSPLLQERLALWRLAPPKRSDFFSAFDIFGVENYLFVLYGMHYPTRPGRIGGAEAEKSASLIAELQAKSLHSASGLLSHRVWLTELKKALAAQQR